MELAVPDDGGGDATVTTVLIEAADEGLPFRTGDDLRPIPDLLQGVPTFTPPPLLLLSRTNPLPPDRSDGTGGLGPSQAGYPEATASLRENDVVHFVANVGLARRRYFGAFRRHHLWVTQI